MDMLEALDRAADGFSLRLRAAHGDAWTAPTPCSEWDVRALVLHVIGGNHFSVALLDGATAQEAIRAGFGIAEKATDLPAAFEVSAEAQRAVFARPGALDGIVHHVVGDMPASMLLGFRISDMAVHSWDLARGLNVDDTLDPELLEMVWGFAAPMADGMRASGRFGDGATGTLTAEAPLQHRVLDLHGRRP